jgi:hypothetical protein
MADAESRPHTLDLLAKAVKQATELLSLDLGLLRAELGEKSAQLRNSLIWMMASAVVLLISIILLLEGVVAWLVAMGFQSHIAFFIVGGIVAVIGLAILLLSINRLGSWSATPKRALTQLDQSAQTIKRAFSDGK